MARKYSQGVADSNRRRAKHGLYKSRLYVIWSSLKHRCNNPNSQHYHRYGGRGVIVCDKWTASFEAFRADVGDPPERGVTLDRIDNAKGYEPGNVRWATRKQQANNRDTNVVIEHEGKSMTLMEWAEHFGWKYGLLASRWKSGLRGEALFAPPKLVRNVGVTHEGVTRTLREWATVAGVPYETIWWRYKNGKPIL